jgi:N-acetylmuramic acid 6-phosphate (MurNAc-6-P) etherase
MKASMIAAALAGAGLLASASLTAAQEAGPPDHEAGVPLTPAEAVGVWTVASAGHDLCTLSLTAAHGVKAPATCGEALTGSPTAWTATSDGMALNGPNGQLMIAFHRWSNSLFVSHRSSGVDIQLRRGGHEG